MGSEEMGVRVFITDPDGELMLFTINREPDRHGVINHKTPGGGANPKLGLMNEARREIKEEVPGLRDLIDKKQLIQLEMQVDPEGKIRPSMWFLLVLTSDELLALDNTVGDSDVESVYVDRVENATANLTHDKWRDFFREGFPKRVRRKIKEIR